MGTTMQKVKAVRDDSGHWYVIPNDASDEFMRDGRNEAFCDSGGFDKKWGKYRTGGSLNLVQLYAEI